MIPILHYYPLVILLHEEDDEISTTSNDDTNHITFEALPQFLESLQQLRVKFPHIDDDLRPIFEDFTNGVFHGNKENKFKFPVYKLRIASRDLQAGRQGGFRLIYLNYMKKVILLMLIYSKADQGDIQLKEIKSLNEALQQFYEVRCPFCYQDSPINEKHFFINKRTNKAQMTKNCPKFNKNK